MSDKDFLVLVQIIKTGLLILLFAIILIYVLKKLISTFRKGTTHPINFNSVSNLLSLGLTVLLFSPKVNYMFDSVFRIFVSFSDYIFSLFIMNSGASPAGSKSSFDLIQFPFADVVVFFAVWLFISTFLNIFFQNVNKTNSSKFFPDNLFAKNSLVVFLLIFSIYLCVASIIAIPEFQALEDSEFDNDELTEFAIELDQQSNNKIDDLLLKELLLDNLKLNMSIDVYNNYNNRITSYNQIINRIWNDLEMRKRNALDEYKSAILEKMAIKERILHRSRLKNWLQHHVSGITYIVYYKPRFESNVRDAITKVFRAEKDSLLTNDDTRVDSLYEFLYDSYYKWDMLRTSMEASVFDVNKLNYMMPDKPQIGERFGIFQSMSGWLLKTESMSLALIVGLFAFGLLGSIGSTFIRQRIKTGSDADIKDFIPNLPAVLINGISSAIVVFLAVKGTLVVFSGKDPGINPYVLFFTCLVAAVFSEDVWKWAHNKLNDQFNSNKNPEELLGNENANENEGNEDPEEPVNNEDPEEPVNNEDPKDPAG